MKTRLFLTIVLLCALTAGLVAGLWGCAVAKKLPARTGSAVKDHVKKPVGDSTGNARNPQFAGADSLAVFTGISPASALIIAACDNYMAINADNPKTGDVLNIKGAVLYNNKLYDESRQVYRVLIDKHKGSPFRTEAIRMTAQSYYEEKKFDQAQEWYKQLRDAAGEGTDKTEALTRIAESVFFKAQQDEAASRFEAAAAGYERVAIEFPDAAIADVALYNAGLAYEKLAEWTRAILMYQRISQQYFSSKLLAKAMFRSAKCYEKLAQWENAGQAYLRVTANFPKSEEAQTSLYNAGFCFENAEKLSEAAAIFEKMSQLYPGSTDAADVLFKAAELYGKLKDWASVTRVNRDFAARFGHDADRAVQALCMVGVALYMEGKNSEAIEQLSRTTQAYVRLKNPSTVNKYYAAKAQFTIGEIEHEALNKIELVQPKSVYTERLRQKSAMLERAVQGYSQVLSYGVSEWITRGINQIGQTYEDFAVSIFKQERPKNNSVEDMLALELGIAQAVDEYFVKKALHYHEQNVKLAIKEKIEDKAILESRAKLTVLPLLAAQNYLAVVEIARSMQSSQRAEGFALIAQKLQLLQRIAPHQERAIDLFLKCLENGSLYQENTDSYKKACSLITRTSFTVGETYFDVSRIAREAPIPASFDPYEAFVYKTKLLKQIEEYDKQALASFEKTLKIAVAYKIDDDYARRTREKLPELLFVRGRSYDLLCLNAFKKPPFPKNATDAEKEEYKARFEEIGISLQEQAFELYQSILVYARQNFASGEYLTHAYVRLYQNSPQSVGVKQERLKTDTVMAGPQWLCTIDSTAGWSTLDYVDSAWQKVHKAPRATPLPITGFPGAVPPPLWFGTGKPLDSAYVPATHLYLRRTLSLPSAPSSAVLYAAVIDTFDLLINGQRLPADSLSRGAAWNVARRYTLDGTLRQGRNVVAFDAINLQRAAFGAYIQLMYTVSKVDYVPQPPGAATPLPVESVAEQKYVFPKIINFTYE